VLFFFKTGKLAVMNIFLAPCSL